MEKGGKIKIILLASIFIITVLIIWQLANVSLNKRYANMSEQESDYLNDSANITLQGETEESDVAETNETIEETNETEIIPNESSNQIVPDPTGSITAIDRRNDAIGDYFCDNNTGDAEHQIRLYAYKIIGGTKNFSENYIESKKINNVCSSYGENVSQEGINYYIEWKWSLVGGADGYRVYQYYHLNNISRDYDYYVDAKTEKLLDTGLGIWVLKSQEQNSSEEQNSSG